MKEELEEIHKSVWTGQYSKDLAGKTVHSNKCISCLQTLEMAREIHHLMQINYPEKLEYYQTMLKRVEIQIDAIISRLEENLEIQKKLILKKMKETI